MILLTDDEIIKGINDGGLAGGGVLTGLSAAGRKEHLGVAKAQLKKVLEYLNARSFVLQPKGEGAVVIISCDWQALLEAAK